MSHILVIDDDPAVAESLKFMLEDLGHTVATAEDGKEGIQALGRERYDLVITDIIMPEKDGLEFLMETRGSHPDLKAIAISGGGRMTSKDYLVMADSFGADAVLTKPISMEELTECVERVLGTSPPA